MDDKGKLVVIGNETETTSQLVENLTSIGYSCTRTDFMMTEFPNKGPWPLDGVLVCLTEWDDTRLAACEKLLDRNTFPKEDVPIIAVINENTMRKIPRGFKFNEMIIIPYNLPETEFRLDRVIYQFRQKASRNIIEIGDISIALDSYEVRVKDELLSLTLKEYELLKHLATNRGRVFTREALLSTIWGFDYFGGTRTVDVHIRRLRAKTGDLDETYIKTVRGVGYTIRPPQ